MKYRIVETKNGFEVEGYFEDQEWHWLDRILTWERFQYRAGWKLLNRDGDRFYYTDWSGYGDYEPNGKQAIFKTLEKATKFIEKISKNAVVHAN